MAKFKKENEGGTPAISTASLPDIVFMLLFFFMVTTHMKENTLNVKHRLPKATEIKKLEKKSLVCTIHVGPPVKQLQGTLGTVPRMQLNDQFGTVEDIKAFIENARSKIPEPQRPQLTVSLKVDRNTKMGLITDIKQALRKQNALKINYSTLKGKE